MCWGRYGLFISERGSGSRCGLSIRHAVKLSSPHLSTLGAGRGWEAGLTMSYRLHLKMMQSAAEFVAPS